VRGLVSVAALLGLSVISFGADPQNLPEWDIRYLEKEWGLRLKGVHFTAATDKAPAKFELLMSFDREIPETFLSEFTAQFPAVPAPCSSITFHCFDIDDVAAGRASFYLSAGELTGKVGDAFKVTVLVEKAVLDKITETRVIAPGPPPILEIGRIRVRPVPGLPRAGEYRDALSLRLRPLTP
jgi:hypothetical protein